MKPVDPRLLRRVRSARGPLEASVAIGIAHAACVIGQAVVLADVVARAVVGGASLTDVRSRLVVLALIVVARAALTWTAEVAGRAAATAVKSELRGQLLERIVGLDPSRRATASRGELVTVVGHGLDALDGYFSRYLPQLILAAIVPVVVVVVAAREDMTAAVILAVTLPLIPVFMALIGLATRDRTERQWRALADLGGHLLDVVEGLPTLRIFGRARRQREVLTEMADAHRTSTMVALRIAFTSSLVLELIATLGTALVAVSVGLRLVDATIDLRTALLVLLLAPEAYLPLRNVGAAFHASTEGATAAQQALDLLEAAGAHERAEQSKLPASLTPIAFESVTVTYPDRTEPALDDVSLTVQPGERVAIVGPSGAGKTTLLAAILGFVTPDTGRVTAGGADLAGLPLDDWRRHLAWVPQRPHLFADTIAANIRLGQPDASDADVERAAAAARALPFIERLRDGMATRIGDGGLPLSGGEMQRIALARAFLRDAPIVLLDEPTASLDGATEDDVLAAFATLLEGRTAIVVTHRRAPIALADRILLVDHGRVSEPARSGVP